VPSNRIRGQQGLGLVEVLVASALMAVAVVVLLGSLSSLLLGSRIAERRTVEERLARTQIERLMGPAQVICPTPRAQPVDSVTYTVETTCAMSPGYVELTVVVTGPEGSSESLSVDRVQP
jgi:Tfp pilus assembly protein PilV